MGGELNWIRGLIYLDLTKDEFWDAVDRFRQDHIWEKKRKFLAITIQG